MRKLIFGAAVAAVLILTASDASAFGRRGSRAAVSNGCGGCGSSSYSYAGSSYSSRGTAYSGGAAYASPQYGNTPPSGSPQIIPYYYESGTNIPPAPQLMPGVNSQNQQRATILYFNPQTASYQENPLAQGATTLPTGTINGNPAVIYLNPQTGTYSGTQPQGFQMPKTTPPSGGPQRIPVPQPEK